MRKTPIYFAQSVLFWRFVIRKCEMYYTSLPKCTKLSPKRIFADYCKVLFRSFPKLKIIDAPMNWTIFNLYHFSTILLSSSFFFAIHYQYTFMTIYACYINFLFSSQSLYIMPAFIDMLGIYPLFPSSFHSLFMCTSLSYIFFLFTVFSLSLSLY